MIDHRIQIVTSLAGQVFSVRLGNEVFQVQIAQRKFNVMIDLVAGELFVRESLQLHDQYPRQTPDGQLFGGFLRFRAFRTVPTVLQRKLLGIGEHSQTVLQAGGALFVDLIEQLVIVRRMVQLF